MEQLGNLVLRYGMYVCTRAAEAGLNSEQHEIGSHDQHSSAKLNKHFQEQIANTGIIITD